MDFPAYLADPCETPSLTSSNVKLLLSSAPAMVRMKTPRLNPEYVDTADEKFRIGTAAHALLVGGGEKIGVIEYPNYKTNKAKRARDRAIADGRTPVLEANFERVKAMVKAAERQFGESDLGEFLDDHHLRSEATILWREAGTLNRCRPDWLMIPDYIAPIVIHYKTLNVSLGRTSLARYAVNMGWDLIAAHYGAGVKMLTGVSPAQGFAVQQQFPPYLTRVVNLDEMFIRPAMARRAMALDIWAKCVATGSWPGYGGRTVTLECPHWHEAESMAQVNRARKGTQP